jgi:lipopolysaccharide export LptBFGC system permease protein LptF
LVYPAIHRLIAPRQDFCCKLPGFIEECTTNNNKKLRTGICEYMVFTLHRYILRELLRAFILATLALTMMMSLGSILQPVQEYGVGPRQVLYLMAYFLPITLTFVLPIAALFSSTLIYGRFASDNELDACRASGISVLTLIYPGLMLAIIVAIANLLLSFYVMPAFMHRAEKSIKADAKQILFRNIQRKDFYELPSDDPDEQYLVYADMADPKTDTLLGVVVVEVKGGAIEKMICAEAAKIVFNPHERFNEVQIIASNTYQIDSEGSLSLGLFRSNREFESLLGDSIQFKNIEQMKQIRDVDLMLYDPIARLARRVHAQLVSELLCRDISDVIARESENYYKFHSGSKFVDLSALSCKMHKNDEKKIELTGEVVVNEARLVVAVDSNEIQEEPLRTLRAERGLLYVEGDDLSPTLTLELYSPKWQKADGTKGFSWGRTRIRGLLLPGSVKKSAAKFKTERGLKVKQLADAVLFQSQPSGPKLRYLQSVLGKEIRDALVEIGAEIHIRLVFGVGCVSMILIGIGLGILKKGGHPLAAFGISCVPAALLVVFMLMGKNIAKNAGSSAVSGITLMWTGLIVLCVLTIVVYQRLLKY